jgi:ATP-binding cassette, subfamily B, multidrug efflux pump
MKKIDRTLLMKLWRYLLPYRPYVMFSVFILMVSKAIEAYVPVFIGQVTEEILLGHADQLSQIIRQSVTIMGLLLFAYFLDTANVMLKNWIGQRALFTLRSDVYRHLQRMPIEYYNHQKVGTLMTRTIHDVDQINQMFAESLVPLLGSVMLFFSIAFFLILLDWRVALLLGAMLPVVFSVTRTFSVQQRRCYRLIRQAVSKINAFVQEHLLGASTIRSFGLQNEEKKQFDQLNLEHREANVETIRHFSKFFANIDFIQSFSLIAVFVVLVVWVPSETGFQAGTYFTFSLYVLMLFRPLSDLADRYNVLQSAVAAGERIFNVLDQPQESSGGSEAITALEHLAFEDVWFAYQNEEWVLKGLSFEVRKGESVALVGMTGAGKTTILNLLLRFYPYQKGRILVNGIEISEYEVEDVRRLFAVVHQDPELFSGSIRDNICLDSSEISDQQLQKTIQFMHLEGFLDKYPAGIDHMLTERGKDLSAGERQLVAMARAMVHDRSCLILDEATANIDSRTEKLIQAALKKILHMKTAVVIAHRLSTIKDVSRIVVIHQGIVKETGTHAELLKANGIYEKLYRLQFL